MAGSHHDHDRMGEFELIARYFAPLAEPDGAFGLMDDAARLRAAPDEDLVLTKDTLVAGVHFFADDPPDLIARKALRVNISDLAAKGATPKAYLLSLALPRDWSPDWLETFARGLAEDQDHYTIRLLGGDTVKSRDGLVISVTAIGTLPRDTMVTRLGGRTGDALYVSGTIGDAALGLSVHGAASETAGWAISDEERDHLRRRYLLPLPRVALAPLIRAHASAAMDISDGLVGDLAKLCSASGLGAVVRVEDIPLSPATRAMIRQSTDFRTRALNGGDDYELLCAVPPERTCRFEEAVRATGIAATRIGELTKFARGVSVVDDGGEPLKIQSGSFQHF